MKKIFIALCVMVALPFAGNAQSTQPSQPSQPTQPEYPIFSFGFSGGLDYDKNAFKTAPTAQGGTYFGENPRYNIGADFGVQIIKRIRPRIELKYVNVKYAIDWNAVSNLGQTTVNLNYFDINLRVDLLALPIKKFQFFVSPAFKYEYQTSSSVVNNYVMTDGLMHQPSSIIGFGISGIFKYNITDNFGITLTPEQTYFSHSFATGNTKPYQRTSYNIGFEYKF